MHKSCIQGGFSTRPAGGELFLTPAPSAWQRCTRGRSCAGHVALNNYLNGMLMKKTKSILMICLLTLLWPAGLLLAQDSSIVLDGDIRVFSVMAALHVAGFKPAQISPMSQPIIAEFDTIPAELRERMQQFYQAHLHTPPSEEQFSAYLSLALLTDGPPDFKLTISLTNLPPDAQDVYEFLRLVREFYAAGKIERVWSSYRRYYDAAVVKARPSIDQLMMRTDGYLRIDSSSFLDRRLLIIPEYLVASNSINARNYRELYYLIFSPAERLKTDEFRHQYLHFLLDPFALRYSLSQQARIELVKFLESAPKIEERYLNDSQFMLVESMIRALELRMNKVADPKLSDELTACVREGAIFTRYFYEELGNFEKSQEGFKLFYSAMAKNIQFSRVKSNFEAAQAAPLPKPPEPNIVKTRLMQANSSLADEQYDAAKEIFESILKDNDQNNGEAFYGLGLVSIMKKPPEINLAKEFFQKAVQAASCPNGSKVWAYIYLGASIKQPLPWVMTHAMHRP
jgi:hypothetical protein